MNNKLKLKLCRVKFATIWPNSTIMLNFEENSTVDQKFRTKIRNFDFFTKIWIFDKNFDFVCAKFWIIDENLDF